tara:strand:- start:165 stop:485 length:321 start_codon:yes stop_codon:yes gene_type:complete
VTNLSRLQDESTAVGPSSDETGCPSKQAQCLLAGTKAGCQHLAIDIQYDDSVGMRNPMQYRFGANKHFNRWASRPVGLGISINNPRRTTCCGCQLFHESSGARTKI